MKAKVVIPFFDENGLHRIGDVIETASLNRYLDKYADKSAKKVEQTLEAETQIAEAETQMHKKRIKKNA
jgi:hypothetical protein